MRMANLHMWRMDSCISESVACCRRRGCPANLECTKCGHTFPSRRRTGTTSYAYRLPGPIHRPWCRSVFCGPGNSLVEVQNLADDAGFLLDLLLQQHNRVDQL